MEAMILPSATVQTRDEAAEVNKVWGLAPFNLYIVTALRLVPEYLAEINSSNLSNSKNLCGLLASTKCKRYSCAFL
jgi:hypothetical protein